jgi:hypothetical protein
VRSGGASAKRIALNPPRNCPDVVWDFRELKAEREREGLRQLDRQRAVDAPDKAAAFAMNPNVTCFHFFKNGVGSNAAGIENVGELR